MEKVYILLSTLYELFGQATAILMDDSFFYESYDYLPEHRRSHVVQIDRIIPMSDKSSNAIGTFIKVTSYYNKISYEPQTIREVCNIIPENMPIRITRRTFVEASNYTLIEEVSGVLEGIEDRFGVEEFNVIEIRPNVNCGVDILYLPKINQEE